MSKRVVLIGIASVICLVVSVVVSVFVFNSIDIGAGGADTYALLDEDIEKILTGNYMITETEKGFEAVEVFPEIDYTVPYYMTRTMGDFFYGPAYSEVALDGGYRFNVMQRYADDLSVETEDWPIDGIEYSATCYHIYYDGIEAARYIKYPADYLGYFERQYGTAGETLFYDGIYAVVTRDVAVEVQTDEEAIVRSDIGWCLFKTIRK
ncbi:hypothetical protein B5F10_02800 [Anaerotruncus colihominis]|uniref:Uncharacterized protein n=1 Tax=Anaerotruncus colihominis TaxID=169435 RepID=A0A1Y4N5B9_9FIRM|nr:hypothetical protein [Anaerotruncus colihominis]OUP70576.1 hypothetical protein B5F11_03820 [Anaerotruncus colihominis]OUP76088.1 hypothetical protein B5F10_02800 [Anaerotruncus colihominis]